LSIFSDRILDSSVDGFMPSLAAAPDGPDTRPRVSLNAPSIISISRAKSDQSEQGSRAPTRIK